MTPKLVDRLSKLEGSQRAANANVGPYPPELAHVYLQSIAVCLGGFPQPAGPSPDYRPDDINDGFARGLGYADRDEMEAGFKTHPQVWTGRVEGAERTLAARFVRDPTAKGIGCGPEFQIFCGALDEISGRMSSNVAPGTPYLWPKEKPKFDHTAVTIRLALSQFGIVEDDLVMEACG